MYEVFEEDCEAQLEVEVYERQHYWTVEGTDG
jgi:hypothetical protein